MPPLSRSLPLTRPFDPGSSYRPFRRGHGDPTIRIAPGEVLRATRTPDGAATVSLRLEDTRLRVTAWGAGARWLVDRATDLTGCTDRPDRLTARHPTVRALQRRLTGLRIVRTGAVMEALVPAILEQKVTGLEARRSWQAIVRRWGEPAPGPGSLWLPPHPAALAQLPYFELHRFGVERRRADVIRRVCARASRLEACADLDGQAAAARLSSLPGVGPWTVAEVAGRAFGDPDAVPVGDFHLPNLVSWALAGEPRGDDDRMLELLAPYAGQRGRVIRLIEAAHPRPPAFGPRARLRSIATI